MTRRSLLPILALVALPLAAASYGEGSELEVASPARVGGQADTLLPSGIASFVGASGQAVFVRLVASEAEVTHRTVDPACANPGGVPSLPTNPCSPEASSDADVTTVLTDVTITVMKPVSAFKVVVTSDRNYADSSSFGSVGDIIVTTGASTQLATNEAGMHLSGADEAWAEDGTASPAFEPVYSAEPGSAEFSATGGVLRATDGFETFLQGLQIKVMGTTEDGEPFSETFETPMPDSENEPFTMLIVETTGGDLQATSVAPFLGYAPADQRPITDVHSDVDFTGATGQVTYAGGESGTQEYTDSAVTLDGPLSLTLTKIAEGRMTYAIQDGLQIGSLDEPIEDEPIPPEALAAAGAAGAGGAGALIALAYFWPRLKYWATLMAIPMYTRIERDAVLEHEKRDELYELIRVTPGIHAHEIGEKANIGWGTTVYHLKLLENHGLIVSKKSGRYKRFFVNTGEYTKKKDIYGALRNETAKAVADYVVNHPGTTQKEMCAALNIQPSLASWHVEKLEGVELVKRVKDGRMVRYFAGPAWSDLNVRVDPLAGGADTPVET